MLRLTLLVVFIVFDLPGATSTASHRVSGSLSTSDTQLRSEQTDATAIHREEIRFPRSDGKLAGTLYLPS